MCKISNNSRPDSRKTSESQNRTSGNDNQRFADIKKANQKVRLIDVLHSYGFKIERNYQRSEWSTNIICPFPSHKNGGERTASFGYNFKQDRFVCLGCNLTGQAVEFISAFTGKTRNSVVKDIFARYGDEDNVALNFIDYDDKITKILLDGSKFLQIAIQTYKNNPEMLDYINKLIWWLDFYITSKSPHCIDSSEFQVRLERVKELLSDEQMFNSR